MLNDVRVEFHFLCTFHGEHFGDGSIFGDGLRNP
jgi:hypothetical protein